MYKIYEIELFTSAIYHYKQGKPGSPEMTELPFGSCLSDSLDGQHRLQGTG